MNMIESDRDAQDVKLYDHYVEVINKGPLTAGGIGEALWRIQEQQLYRHVVHNMRTFYSLAKMEAEEGAKLIEEWKSTPLGRAVIAEGLKGQEDIQANKKTDNIIDHGAEQLGATDALDSGKETGLPHFDVDARLQELGNYLGEEAGQWPGDKVGELATCLEKLASVIRSCMDGADHSEDA